MQWRTVEPIGQAAGLDDASDGDCLRGRAGLASHGRPAAA